MKHYAPREWDSINILGDVVLMRRTKCERISNSQPDRSECCCIQIEGRMQVNGYWQREVCECESLDVLLGSVQVFERVIRNVTLRFEVRQNERFNKGRRGDVRLDVIGRTKDNCEETQQQVFDEP